MRDQIQFYHKIVHRNFQGKKYPAIKTGRTSWTLLVDVPSVSLLKKTVYQKQKYLMTNVGMSVCSEKDQFCRQIGREVATSKTTSLQCDLKCVTFYDDNIAIYTFDVPVLEITFDLKTRNDKEVAHLIYANEMDNNEYNTDLF